MRPVPQSVHTIVFGALLGCFALFYLRSFCTHGLEREKRRAWTEAVSIPIVDRKLSYDDVELHFIAKAGRCPYCGGVIHLVPVSPSGDRIVTYGTERPALEDRFYAYCLTPDRKGMMPFQFGFRMSFLSDDMVSWFFSKRLDDLTDQEIDAENVYRARIGRNAVSKR